MWHRNLANEQTAKKPNRGSEDIQKNWPNFIGTKTNTEILENFGMKTS